jgi:hypothetical protein
MKKLFIFLIAVIAVGLVGYGLLFLYQNTSVKRKAEGAGEKPVQSCQFTMTNQAGQPFIKLDSTSQKQFGIRTEPLRCVVWTNELQTFATIIDLSPLASVLTELNTAMINLDLSKREYERVKNLYESGKNAPYKNVEVALAELQKNQELIKGIKNKLAIQWGEKIADIHSLESFTKQIAEGKKSIARVTLLPGQRLLSVPPTATLSFVGEPGKAILAKFFAIPSFVETGEFSQSFLYEIDGTNLPAGLKLEARLTAPELVVSGIFIPGSAVVRALGMTWAYKSTGDGEFQRFPVTEAIYINGGFIVTNGYIWKENDSVVCNGAQMLLSEELKSQIKLVE